MGLRMPMRTRAILLLLVALAPLGAVTPTAEAGAICQYNSNTQVQPFTWDPHYARVARYRCFDTLSDRYITLQVDLVGVAQRAPPPSTDDPIVVQFELQHAHSQYFDGRLSDEHIVLLYDTVGLLGSTRVTEKDETRYGACESRTSVTRGSTTPLTATGPCMPFLNVIG